MSLDGLWKYGITLGVKLRKSPLVRNIWFGLKSLDLLKKARGIRARKSCQLNRFSASDAGGAVTMNDVLIYWNSGAFDIEIPVIFISVNKRECVRKSFASSTPALTSFNLQKFSTQPRVYPKCMVLNCRSLVKPFAVESFSEELRINSVDLAFVSKSWLNELVADHLIKLNGFNILLRDRERRRSGGVAIMCRDDWKMERFELSIP